jgi:glycosyltransferase involved in cell wall biosynthesis
MMSVVTEDETLPVSVIIPVLGGATTLPRALAGVAAQRPLRAAQVIVVDDGSSDCSGDVAQRLGATVLRHEVNRGIDAARNTALEVASQPWLAFLGADDEWLPHHLATVWALRGGHVLVAGSALSCGADPHEDRLHGPVLRREFSLTSPADLLRAENFLPLSAAMARADVVRAVGGFRPRAVEDLDLWVRLLEHGSGAISPSVTMLYHRHEGQASADVARLNAGQAQIVADCADRPWYTPALAERARWLAAYDALRAALAAGRAGEALGHGLTLLARPQRLAAATARVRRRLASLRFAPTHPHRGT